MWGRKTVAVIFPTSKEKNSIFDAIQEFDASGYVDEIVVVDSNAEEGTEKEVKKTRARFIKEPRRGLGRAIKTGIASTKADLVIISEPDGTYDGKDVVKLLAFSDDFETVFGSRTHVPLVRKGSEMTFLRRITNVWVGKLICLLFLSPPLSDLGCTLRITDRKGWQKVSRECNLDNEVFTTEWLLLAAKNRVKFVDIPVNFRQRVGESSPMGSFTAQAKRGILISYYIAKIWLSKILKKKSSRKASRSN